MIRWWRDFHTSSLDSSSSTSVDTEGTLGLCQEIWSRRSLKRDPWLAAWVGLKDRLSERSNPRTLSISNQPDTQHVVQRPVWRSHIYKPQSPTSVFQEQLQPHPNLPNPAPASALWWEDEQSSELPGTCSSIRGSPVSLLRAPGGTSPSVALPAAAPNTIKLKLGDQSLWNFKIQR